ncbi:prepilin-type N-terminal cleavage/methylation domain-containing protein [bacterium]|nr:prepilin-type N-terminal cleavage/methylation domain-containing protein [bacterium]
MRGLRSGYSLIEALIVVTVLAILMLIAIPNYQNAQIRTKVSRSRVDLRTLCQAVQSYDVDNQSLPPAKELGIRFIDPRFLTSPVTYLPTVPEDIFFSRQTLLTRQGAIALTYPVAAQYGYYALSPVHARILGQDLSFILAGRGPDMKIEFGYLLVEYDPSNGIRSRGDLIIGGPGNKTGIFDSIQ